MRINFRDKWVEFFYSPYVKSSWMYGRSLDGFYIKCRGLSIIVKL